jgi:hypothetical protein
MEGIHVNNTDTCRMLLGKESKTQKRKYDRMNIFHGKFHYESQTGPAKA